MTDKALAAALQAAEPELFSDNPEVAHKAASPLKMDVARDEQVAKITAAISAYLSALPGEAEVVAWRGDDAGGGRKFTAMSRVSEIWADQCLIVTPLVTLYALQAMQARAEKAERERDEAVRIAKKVSTALVDLTPSGSEYFTHSSTLDAYFADTEACTRVVRERYNAGHNAKIAQVHERRRAQAAEARVKVLEIERDTLLAAINQVGLTPEQKSWVEAFFKTRTALKGGSNG